jgi:hypothetical protein
MDQLLEQAFKTARRNDRREVPSPPFTVGALKQTRQRMRADEALMLRSSKDQGTAMLADEPLGTITTYSAMAGEIVQTATASPAVRGIDEREHRGHPLLKQGGE